MKELDEKELAVLSALVMVKVRNFNFSAYQFACKTLDGIHNNFSEEEFEEIVLKFVENDFSEFIFSLDVDKVRGNRKFKNMTDAKFADWLGDKSVFLINGPLRARAKKIYEIEFNCDGKGGIRHPDGSVIHGETLTQLANRIPSDQGLEGVSHAGDLTRYAWKVNPDKHPVLGNKKSVHIWKFIQEYQNT